MKSLKEFIKEAGANHVAIGHFNISDLAALKAIFDATRELSPQTTAIFGEKLPILIGTSEGEREFIGPRQAAVLVRSLREEYGWPIFLNADHTHSFEKIKEAFEAGYDALLFDGGKLPFEENIKQTKQVVDYVKSKNPEILVEGELGYIGSSSEILEVLPEGAATELKDFTTPEEAERFVRETGVDLLAPAVGNIHGMVLGGNEPTLNIQRISDIKKAIGETGIVLHGGSGTSDADFTNAIAAGISIIHINTEIRLAWRKGLEKSLADYPKEIAPYKLFPGAVEAVKDVVYKRLRLFNNLKN
ncbi:class II fructose-bisphosphate aldolase [Patescibacteria group bacterium]|nr:class II fructose-bisphosphate aldolase [Patescibacteria group bacterium]MCL5733438.1 class II fructose-bisphosphate aldolase [Patescibacteria group bacterium]